MPRWGRPPAARPGRHNRGGGGTFWGEDTRVEEIESEEEEDHYVEDHYGRQPMRDGRGYMRQIEYGGRGPRRRTINNYDLIEENETASVDGGDYDLYGHGDSTVAYAVQLAMRDKEDQLVETALERIRRAQMLGKKNPELDALERKRQQTEDPSGARRVRQAGASMTIKPPSKRKSNKARGPDQTMAPYPSTPIEPGWGPGFGAAPGRPSSSSSAHRPRTPTTQSLRPQQSNSPLRPTYPPFTERFPQNGRPLSMPVHQQQHQQQPPPPLPPHQPAYPRPLPDDPSWAPPYYHPTQMNPYASEQPPYQPQLPSDLRVGPQSRMSYPAGMSPIQAQYRQSPDNARQSMGAPHPRGGRHEPDSESEISSDEEEETESSSSEEEEDDDEVQVVKVVERPSPAGFQRRKVSGGSSRAGQSSRPSSRRSR
ncbi:unnamed protein product [Penicillium pancosmium]